MAQGGIPADTITNLIGDPLGDRAQGWAEDQSRANVVSQDLMKTALRAEDQTLKLNLEVTRSLNQMKRECGLAALGLSTSVSIANRTGADMQQITSHDYHGGMGRYPPPQTIGPGQIGIFLHAKAFGFHGSKAAIVYRVVTPKKQKKDVLLAFDVGWRLQRRRHVHVEIQDTEFYIPELFTPSGVKSLRYKIAHGDQNIEKATNMGLEVRGTIGQAYSPLCEFTIKYDPSYGPNK